MQLDREIFLWVQGLTGNPVMDELMFMFAEYLVVLVPVSLIYLWFKDREASLFTFYTAVLGIGLTYVMGLFYGHSKPSAFFETIAAFEPENAFPSQHTTSLLAAALPLLYREKKKIGSILLISGLLTGFGRVYIGEHWPIDILGALFAAIFALVITAASWDKLESFWRPLIDYSRKLENQIKNKLRSINSA